MCDVVGIDEAELTHRTQFEMTDDLLVEVTAQLLVALAADAEELDRLALVHQRQCALARETDDRGIESAGQAALAGADQQQVNLILAGADEQRRAGACRRSAGDEAITVSIFSA